MKLLTFVLMLLCNFCYSQKLINDLLDSDKDNVTKMMSKQLPNYKIYKPSYDSSGVNRIEFSLVKDSIPDSGILAYLFYFENPTSVKCTGIRIIWHDEEVFKKYFNMLTQQSQKTAANLWYDEKSNVTLAAFYYVKENYSFYFIDIQRPIK